MAENPAATKDAERGFENWVVRPLQETQAAIAKGAESWLQAARPFLPGLGNGPFSDRLVELIDKSFDCAGQVLDIQRDFTKAILGMLQQVEEKAEPRARARATTG